MHTLYTILNKSVHFVFCISLDVEINWRNIIIRFGLLLLLNWKEWNAFTLSWKYVWVKIMIYTFDRVLVGILSDRAWFYNHVKYLNYNFAIYIFTYFSAYYIFSCNFTRYISSFYGNLLDHLRLYPTYSRPHISYICNSPFHIYRGSSNNALIVYACILLVQEVVTGAEVLSRLKKWYHAWRTFL